MEILIIAGGATLPPAPAPTSTGTLEPVGLIPLASSSNRDSREPFLAKVLYFLRLHAVIILVYREGSRHYYYKLAGGHGTVHR